MPNRSRPLPRIHDIDAVVFDLDGVLVDSESLHFRAANLVLARFGRSISEEEYTTYVGTGEAATWDSWRRRFALPDSVEELCAVNTEIRVREIAAAGVPAIDEAVQLARQLRTWDVRLAIASSSTRPVIDALLGALGVDDLFAVRVSGEDPDIHHPKPAPDVYLAAASRLAVAPAACVAIEDSEPGILSATRAGITCIAVPNRWTAHQDFSAADVVLESLRYFPLLLL
jgi:HAD superfamily hydrolase (TIGR01509 family)